MNTRSYFKITGGIFLVIAALHLLRLFYGWEASIGGVLVPLWVSWLAVPTAGFLGFTGLTRKK